MISLFYRIKTRNLNSQDVLLPDLNSYIILGHSTVQP